MDLPVVLCRRVAHQSELLFEQSDDGVVAMHGAAYENHTTSVLIRRSPNAIRRRVRIEDEPLVRYEGDQPTNGEVRPVEPLYGWTGADADHAQMQDSVTEEIARHQRRAVEPLEEPL